MAMSLSIIHSRALDGLSAAAVEVEVHLANGLLSSAIQSEQIRLRNHGLTRALKP